ncbi:MAG: Ig-like domain-containing protein [Gemmatimonadaceae bacterium]|nr:Ig-like domain-containing protein [Gemmatimonadaceae bacterium]
MNRLKPHWTTAKKLTTAVISTAAALVSVLSYARSYGFWGDETPMRLTVADLSVARVELLPEADTARAIGDTLRLAARVTDKHGTVLLGATMLWSSANPEIASVDGEGTVVARGAGTTVVLVSVRDHVARSIVTVLPRVAHVHVLVDSTLHLREGDTRRIAARATDAHGYVIPRRPAVWRVADTTVATIDSTGLITALATGRTTITATIDGVAAQADMEVTPALGALELVAGDHQRARVHTPLPSRVVVRLVSRRGKPVPGVVLRPAVADGEGTAEPAAPVTDAHGEAFFAWTLGGRPGRQRLVVRADGLDSALTLDAEADPAAADTHISVVSDPPVAHVGELVPHGVTVRLTDSLGVPLAGVPVAWSTPAGGEITGLAARTDSLGEARAQWRLGPKSGPQGAYLQVGSGRTIPPFPITAIALAGAPVAITVVSGDAQRGVVGAPLTRPVVIRVTDRGGNGVFGATVRWAPASGEVPDSVVTTDSAGRALVHWTLGRTAGAQHMRVHVAGLSRSVVLSATARPLGAANVAFLDAPSEGTAGHPLAKPIRVQVTDAYGNPVEKVLVVFTAHSGSATPTRVMTDAHGVASTRWTLGSKPGEQSLSASVRGAEARGRLTVDALPATRRRARE